jgi:hypothetical protein
MGTGGRASPRCPSSAGRTSTRAPPRSSAPSPTSPSTGSRGSQPGRCRVLRVLRHRARPPPPSHRRVHHHQHLRAHQLRGPSISGRHRPATDPARHRRERPLPLFQRRVHAQASGPKEFVVVPGARHIDLYDRDDLIPFGESAAFYTDSLARRRRQRCRQWRIDWVSRRRRRGIASLTPPRPSNVTSHGLISELHPCRVHRWSDFASQAGRRRRAECLPQSFRSGRERSARGPDRHP